MCVDSVGPIDRAGPAARESGVVADRAAGLPQARSCKPLILTNENRAADRTCYAKKVKKPAAPTGVMNSGSLRVRS